MLRILLIEQSRPRAGQISAGLASAGHLVVALAALPPDLAAEVERHRADVIIIDTEAPDGPTLECLAALDRQAPRPVIVLATSDDAAAMRAAVRAGVAAYVKAPVEPARLAHTLAVALARFDEQQRLKQELATTTRKLAERKQVEKAKGILMKTRQLDEEQAYALLRRLAMERAQSLGVVAEEVVRMARVLL